MLTSFVLRKTEYEFDTPKNSDLMFNDFVEKVAYALENLDKYN